MIQRYPTMVPSGATKEVKLTCESNSAYIGATLVYRIAEVLEHVEPLQKTDEQQSQTQEKLAANFSEVTNRELPSDLAVGALQLPVLGPKKDLAEDGLEKYNRVLDLLRSISYATSPSRWLERYGKSGVDPFRQQRIHPTSIPLWMAEGKGLSNTHPKDAGDYSTQVGDCSCLEPHG